MKKLVEKLKYILIVPNTFDPDDLRRRQVLNTAIIIVMAIVGTFLIVFLGDEDPTSLFQNDPIIAEDYFEWPGPLINSAITLVFSAALLILNRSSRIPKNLMGWIFVIGVIVIVATSDAPRELTNGRSIFEWAVPITLSVIVLPPTAVFGVDLIITILFWFLGGSQWQHFQTYTLSMLYTVSLLSWLGMTIAERAIRDARSEAKKNAAILEGVAEGVLVLGQNNRIILANRAASKLIRNDLAKVTPLTENVEIGGRFLSFHWSKVEGVGQVAIVRDISRQLEVDRAKDAILGVVSHEMRTPLAAILGFAEVLETSPVPGMATRIRANAQRMMALVNDLLDQAHIEAGVLKMHSENFSPSSLTNAIQDSFCSRSKDKQITLSIVISESLPELLVGDLHRYQQILANLIDNAIKFTKEGGRVDVLLTLCDNDRDKWQMVISDTGIGIPPERLPDIFLPFRRASDYAKRSCQGAGLGLSIAKRIAQLAHGDIEVKSTIGHGSTFTVTLPINGST